MQADTCVDYLLQSDFFGGHFSPNNNSSLGHFDFERDEKRVFLEQDIDDDDLHDVRTIE